MSRLGWLLALALFLPQTSSAIQLRWSNGSSHLTFGTASLCTLLVQADPAEGALPGQWRLLWLADSSGVHFVETDSLTACSADTARVSAIEPPATTADSAAHQITTRFCSTDEAAASVAIFVLDQPGWSKGSLKVVAIDPADPDSNEVIESDEVTYNGGVEGTYAPVLLRASSTHETASLRVSAIGAGLSLVQAISVGAADNLWSVPLTVTARSSTSITGIADVYVPLPQSSVRVANAMAPSAPVLIPADEINVEQVASAGTDTILFRDPNPSYYPKDFAFHFNSVYDPTDPAHPWKGIFHLFYIRNKSGGPDSIIAHAWTDSLGKPWSVDTLAFRPSGVGWDKVKVWAPSIQQVGNLVHMFYTGVDSLNDQRIGYATTEVLGTSNISWTRRVSPCYTAVDAPWADATGHQVPGVIQFRDPFVMPDPDVANYPDRYLLFNAGEHDALPTHYTIGVARNRAGTLDLWDDLGNYEATDHNHLTVTGSLESPIVVRDSLTGAWRMFIANADYDPNGYYSTIFLTQTVGDSLTDIRASEWPQRDSLYNYVGDDADMLGWQACEHLQIGQVHFFAAYEGNGIGITRMHWDPVAQKFIFVHPDVTSVPPAKDHIGVRFFLSELRPTAGVVRFGIESPGLITPQLVVYDVMGRRVRKLTDGRAMQGRSEFTWDCQDELGKPVSTGVYFARMTGAGRAHVVRVPLVR